MTEKVQATALTVDALARDHGLELLRFGYLLCGDRHLAEDLLQDVLLALHRRFPKAMTVDNPIGYARRAMANTNISRARRFSSREVVSNDSPGSPPSVDPDDPAERDALWQALRKLPVRQRTVLVLRFYADWTDEDIAAALGARRGTVRSLASRALAALREDTTLTRADIDTDGGAR